MASPAIAVVNLATDSVIVRWVAIHGDKEERCLLDLIQGELPTLLGHSLAKRVWVALEQLHVYELAATAAQNTAADHQTDPRGGRQGLPAAYGADLG